MKTTFTQFLFLFILLIGCKEEQPVVIAKNTYIEKISINGVDVFNNGNKYNVSINNTEIKIHFSQIIDKNKIDIDKIFLSGNHTFTNLEDSDPKTLKLIINENLNYLQKYLFRIEEGNFLGIKLIDSFVVNFTTQIDENPKFPSINDEELLTLTQKQTFNYFWNYAHPISGTIRERFGSDNVVTTGGTGFGIMAILVAVERNFISRQEGFERINKITNFINEKVVRYHGVLPHWFDGTTGKTVAFSKKDDGADLVETALLFQGLLTAQRYFINGNNAEKAMCAVIKQLWEEVEWSWFQKANENKLYWHWSPNYVWEMNLPISGWNESLIVYVLAASSPTYPISVDVYKEGWARKGNMKNGKKFYDITLPLGENYGGPLFFAHYSFLGINPHNLSDEYANYWEQNQAHTKINYQYCVTNPRDFFGYGENCWGLTASDIPNGYTASSPTNDNGTIAPTGAISSLPYTPEESMRALRYYYNVLGDKLWGEYGFYDSFNLSQSYFSKSYIAIDQGPIIIMIENYRTKLLWNLFMSNEEIQQGLNKLGFTF